MTNQGHGGNASFKGACGAFPQQVMFIFCNYSCAVPMLVVGVVHLSSDDADGKQ